MTINQLFFHFLLALLFSNCQSGDGKTRTASRDTIVKKVIPVPTLPEDEKKRYHNQIEYFLTKTGFLRNFNGSILIAKNGVPVYEKYQGFTDLKTKDSITAETPLQIASTSKPFTAAAVLQLAERGKLDINTPLNEIFPGFPYQGVTVKSLLTHRSGLPEYLYYYEKAKWPRETQVSNNDVLNTLINWRPPQAYRPNAAFNYCNTNYVLLALIVEKISGKPFPQYMKENFFDPLEMHNTYISTMGDTSSANSFDGYRAVWKEDFSDGPYGDKNMYSTPRDLLKWDQAWYNGLVLNEALVDSAFAPYSNERPSTHNYGLGWRLLFTKTGKKVVYHNGHWHGFNSAFARLVDEKATIIILSNKFNRSIFPIGRALYNVFGNYDGKHPEQED